METTPKIKTFPLKMDRAFNQELRIVVTQNDVSMHDYIMNAIKEKMEQEVKK